MHPEYGIITGNVVRYLDKHNPNDPNDYWLFPDPSELPQADIWLGEFTGYYKNVKN